MPGVTVADVREYVLTLPGPMRSFVAAGSSSASDRSSSSPSRDEKDMGFAFPRVAPGACRQRAREVLPARRPTCGSSGPASTWTRSTRRRCASSSSTRGRWSCPSTSRSRSPHASRSRRGAGSAWRQSPSSRAIASSTCSRSVVSDSRAGCGRWNDASRSNSAAAAGERPRPAGEPRCSGSIGDRSRPRGIGRRCRRSPPGCGPPGCRARPCHPAAGRGDQQRACAEEGEECPFHGVPEPSLRGRWWAGHPAVAGPTRQGC